MKIHEYQAKALLARYAVPVPRGEVARTVDEAEAAAVLACTILMAAGVSGSGPTTYDSSVNLGNLIPRIAKYREDFYAAILGLLNRGRDVVFP